MQQGSANKAAGREQYKRFGMKNPLHTGTKTVMFAAENGLYGVAGQRLTDACGRCYNCPITDDIESAAPFCAGEFFPEDILWKRPT